MYRRRKAAGGNQPRQPQPDVSVWSSARSAARGITKGVAAWQTYCQPHTGASPEPEEPQPQPELEPQPDPTLEPQPQPQPEEEPLLPDPAQPHRQRQ